MSDKIEAALKRLEEMNNKQARKEIVDAEEKFVWVFRDINGNVHITNPPASRPPQMLTRVTKYGQVLLAAELITQQCYDQHIEAVKQMIVDKREIASMQYKLEKEKKAKVPTKPLTLKQRKRAIERRKWWADNNRMEPILLDDDNIVPKCGLDELPTSVSDARLDGSSLYYDGIPCKDGHDTAKYASNDKCFACCPRVRKKVNN